jgi:hypothetical protein
MSFSAARLNGEQGVKKLLFLTGRTRVKDAERLMAGFVCPPGENLKRKLVFEFQKKIAAEAGETQRFIERPSRSVFHS